MSTEAERAVNHMLARLHSHQRGTLADIQEAVDDLRECRVPAGISMALVLTGPVAGSWWRRQVDRWSMWSLCRAGQIVLLLTPAGRR